MAKADTSVKYFHSAMPGAPVLNGTAGSLIAVLDACLVNGFGLKTVDSLVVAGNVATANISTGHSAEKDAVVLIAGATPVGLNGEWKVTGTTASTVTFATEGIADQTATGSISLKMAPAGWAKPFSGANLAAYKPTNPTATGCLLRVDDTVAKTARVVGYETMSDVNTGTGPFPTATQRSGGSWWSKSNAADANPRKWTVAVDSGMLYFSREYNSASYSGAYEVTVFGDLVPSRSGDAFACILSGFTIDQSAANPNSMNDNYLYGNSGAAAECYAARSQTALGGSVQLRKFFPYLVFAGSNGFWSGALAGPPYPNPSDGGMYLAPHYIAENASLAVRGNSPGFYCCPQSVPNGTFATTDSVTGVLALPGRTLKAVALQGAAASVGFFDVTGPWR